MKKEVWLIKVGTDERPAIAADIDDVRKEYESLFERNPDLKENVDFIVTHHAVSVSNFYKPNEYGMFSEVMVLLEKGLISKKAACDRLGLDSSERA